eukprot:792233_1
MYILSYWLIMRMWHQIPTHVLHNLFIQIIIHHISKWFLRFKTINHTFYPQTFLSLLSIIITVRVDLRFPTTLSTFCLIFQIQCASLPGSIVSFSYLILYPSSKAHPAIQDPK